MYWVIRHVPKIELNHEYKNNTKYLIYIVFKVNEYFKC